MTDTPDSSIEERAEESAREQIEANRPNEDERRELLEEHRHHLVRDTTSKQTRTDGEESIVQLETTVEAPDTYCFTCEEWVGLSGLNLTGTPRSKTEAYYLGGPPADVADARETIRDNLHDLAAYALENVDHIDDAKAAFEFVGDQQAALVDAADEVIDS